MPEDQKSKTVTMVSLTDQAAMAHTFNPSSYNDTPSTPVATLACHRNQVVVVHTFNPRSRDDYNFEGDISQSQSHSEVSWR